jgi:nucleotide-binding universal stress UspA family protein
MLNIRTILAATDFSSRSQDAFQLARALARDYGARLQVVHVAAPPPGSNNGYAKLACPIT